MACSKPTRANPAARLIEEAFMENPGSRRLREAPEAKSRWAA
jgi:hypothetical protein